MRSTGYGCLVGLAGIQIRSPGSLHVYIRGSKALSTKRTVWCAGPLACEQD